MSTSEQPLTRGSYSAADQRLGRPVLTTWDAIAQSLAIGPVFSSAFVTYLIAAAAGAATPLSALIGAVGVLAVGWVITLYARRYAGAGAIYEYLRHSSPAISLFASGIYFIGALVLDTAGFLIIGFLAAQIFQQYLRLAIPWWVFALLATIIVAAVNYWGIRFAVRIQLVLTTISLIPLLLLALVIIARGGAAGNTLQVFNPGIVPISGVFQGVLFAILLFVGFETSASLGEETANPQRSIPRAVIGTIIISALVYLIVVYAATIGFGIGHTNAWDPAALDTLANRYVGSWLAVLIDIAILFDAFAVMSAFFATTSRGFFALSRDGLLPTPLSTMTRHRTPLGGNIVVLVGGILLVAITIITSTDVTLVFGTMSTIGSLLIEVIYIALAVVAIRFVRESPVWWHWIAVIVAIATPILGIYGSVVPFPPFPADLGVLGAIVAIVISGIWTLMIARTNPQRLAAVATRTIEGLEGAQLVAEETTEAENAPSVARETTES